MKMKKLVSAVSALAMTLSAFAAFTVTADAVELVKFNFDNKTLEVLEKGNNTVWEFKEASEAGASGMAAAGTFGKVLRFGSKSSGTGKNLGYKADMGKIDDGAINLSYYIEPMEVRNDKDANIILQFADSELNPIQTVNVGTGKTKSLTINDDKYTYTKGSYYKISSDLNFYDKTAVTSILSGDGSETLKTISYDLDAKDLQYIYYPDTDWKYGYAALDDITVSTLDGASTTFTVKDTTDKVVEGAEIAIGSKTLTSDSEGKVNVVLPQGKTYSYAVSKSGYPATDGSVTISDVSDKNVDITLNASAKMAPVTINYYITGTTDAVPTLSSVTSEKAVGSIVTEDEITKTEVSADGEKYVYNSTSVALPYTVADGNNTINVYFDKVNKYNVTIKAVGDIEKTIKTYSVFGGDELTCAYPQFIVENGVAYEVSKELSDDKKGYQRKVNAVTQDVVEELQYSKVHENVVFFEDLDDTTGENAGIRASNGSAYNNKTYVSEKSIEPGTYDVYLKLLNKGRGSTLTVGEETLFDYSKYESKNSWNDIKIENITLSGGVISLNAGGSNTRDCLDTILFVKKDAPAPKDYTEADVLKSTDETGLYIGDKGEEFPSAAVITGDIDASNVGLSDTYTWVVNVKDGEESFAQEFNADVNVSGSGKVKFGLVVFNFEKAGLGADVTTKDVKARLYFSGIGDIK